MNKLIVYSTDFLGFMEYVTIDKRLWKLTSKYFGTYNSENINNWLQCYMNESSIYLTHISAYQICTN